MDKLNTKTKLKRLLYVFQLAEYDVPFFLNWIKYHPNLEEWLEKSDKEPVWTFKAKLIFFFARFFPAKKIYYSLILADRFIKPLETVIVFFLILRVKLKLKKFKNLIIIGIAGSYGKTTAKEYLAEVLSVRYQILKSPENINTLIGLAKLILKELDESCQILIVEMAAYKRGDIEKIRKMLNPKIRILTGLNNQHLERFSSLGNIIKTKFEIVEDLSGDNLVFLNADSPLILKNYQKFLKIQPKFYGLNPEISKTFDVKNIKVSDRGLEFDVLKNQKIYFSGKARVFGRHQLTPILLAVSVSDKLELTREEILTGLGNLKPLSRRLSVQKTPQGIVVIDDSYNISEDSVGAALEFLKEIFPNERKIVITAGLVEQGNKKIESNIFLGNKLKEAADIILIPRNSNSPYLINGLELSKSEILEYNTNLSIDTEKRLIIFNNADELNRNLHLILKPNDVVLTFPYDLPAHYY